MAKPTTDSLPSHVQDAVAMLESVLKERIAANPKMAMEDRMASLVEGSGVFKGVAHEMAAHDQKPVTAPTVSGQGKSGERTH